MNTVDSMTECGLLGVQDFMTDSGGDAQSTPESPQDTIYTSFVRLLDLSEDAWQRALSGEGMEQIEGLHVAYHALRRAVERVVEMGTQRQLRLNGKSLPRPPYCWRPQNRDQSGSQSMPVGEIISFSNRNTDIKKLDEYSREIDKQNAIIQTSRSTFSEAVVVTNDDTEHANPNGEKGKHWFEGLWKKTIPHDIKPDMDSCISRTESLASMRIQNLTRIKFFPDGSAIVFTTIKNNVPASVVGNSPCGRPTTSDGNGHTPSGSGDAGPRIPGVRFDTSYMRWVAYWSEGGRPVQRYYSLVRYGRMAHTLAIKARQQWERRKLGSRGCAIVNVVSPGGLRSEPFIPVPMTVGKSKKLSDAGNSGDRTDLPRTRTHNSFSRCPTVKSALPVPRTSTLRSSRTRKK